MKLSNEIRKIADSLENNVYNKAWEKEILKDHKQNLRKKLNTIVDELQKKYPTYEFDVELDANGDPTKNLIIAGDERISIPNLDNINWKFVHYESEMRGTQAYWKGVGKVKPEEIVGV